MNKSILIYEQNKNNLENIFNAIKSSGYFRFVITAKSYSEAILKCEKQKFDVILWYYSKKDNQDSLNNVLKELRKTQNIKNISIMINEIDQNIIETVKFNSLKGIILYPVKIDELLTKLKN